MKAAAHEGSGPHKARGWWFDPRLAIGIGLVVISVVGVVSLVSVADGSTRAYGAKSFLAPGDRINSDDLVRLSVRLGGISGSYLLEGDLPADGLVVTKPIGAGELVPTASVGTTGGVDTTAVVVSPAAGLPRSVLPGSIVDIWAAREGESGVFGAPSVLVPSAIVVRIIRSDGIISDGRSQSVEVLVPHGRTAKVLESLANDDAISLVPASPAAKG
ncbi:MAG: hypothetical protein JWO10_281 [Microbacteriaceae bacterium]|nr:hypothetical protein [Microbacteriaceae bacterium]